MVTQGKFTLSGLENYLEDLAKSGENIDSLVQETLVEAAIEVREEMRNLVPVDEGDLLEGIQIDGPHQNGNFSYVDVGVIHDKSFTGKELAIYGNVQEYGSATVDAHPYIRPALARKKRVVVKAMQKVLTRMGLLK